MFRRILSASLIFTFALAALPATARPDDDRRDRHDQREERGDRENRKYWKERDKDERKYWKEREKEGRKHERHRYEYEDDNDGDDNDHDGNRHYRAPAWMEGYWRADDQRHYVALVPGDPSRMYVFLDGRWVLRLIRDPRARLDL